MLNTHCNGSSTTYPNISTAGTSGGVTLRGPCWHIAGVTCTNCAPSPNRSSACPFCTPRCPHGYPADQVAPPPFVSPFWMSDATTGKPLEFTVRASSSPASVGSVGGYPATFTYTSH